MSKREVKLYLQDIMDCIGKIERYVKDLSFEEFKKDDMVIDAVVRNIEIIGEASNNIPQDTKEKFPDIKWRKIINMRNIIAHEYFGVIVEIIWETIQKEIPQLKNALKKGKK